MTVYNLYGGSWLSNCYILVSRDSLGHAHAAAVDPSTDSEVICSFLKQCDASLDMIILTHGHFDHIMSLDTLRDKTGAPAYVHTDDSEMLTDSHKNAYSFFFSKKLILRPADGLLSDGDILQLGDEKLKVIHLPGHSKGSVALLGEKILVTGDTLFDGGIGRTDLYGGDAMQLYTSLGKFRELDGSLTIYPGHGSSTLLSNALDKIY